MYDESFSGRLPAIVPLVAEPPQVGNLGAIISRIETAVDEETHGIRNEPGYDIKASNARKSRHLYELTRAMRGMGPSDLRAEHRDGLQRLRERLSANEAAILAHLSAVSEVAKLMQAAIERAEADGTYSAGAFGWSR